MRSSYALVAVVSLLALSVVACRGKIAGTAELHGPGTADATFTSTGKPLVLWADTNGEWHGGSNSHFAANYEIDVLSSGNKIAHITCNTRDVHESVCGSKVSVNNTHHGDCELKLDCDLPAIPAGPASLHVVASLGAGTADVKNMSINVRAK